MMGQSLPDLTVESSSGKTVNLQDLKGHKTILYFYPKDNTPGCTIQGNEFNSFLKEFKNLNTVVYGISRDNLKSHDKFIQKCNFKFELLADADEKLCKFFDVIKEKNMYGKKVLGVERSTFIIDAKNKIVGEFRKVKAEGHAALILQAVKQL
ncbi:MAG: peroxiredoxin [Bdellovibrionota bacterium]